MLKILIDTNSQFRRPSVKLRALGAAASTSSRRYNDWYVGLSRETPPKSTFVSGIHRASYSRKVRDAAQTSLFRENNDYCTASTWDQKYSYSTSLNLRCVLFLIRGICLCLHVISPHRPSSNLLSQQLHFQHWCSRVNLPLQTITITVKIQCPKVSFFDHNKTFPSSKVQSSFFPRAVEGTIEVVFCVRTGTEFHLVGISIDVDPVHDGGIFGDAGYEARIPGFGVRKEALGLKNQRHPRVKRMVVKWQDSY